jgi:hypothetical protein
MLRINPQAGRKRKAVKSELFVIFVCGVKNHLDKAKMLMEYFGS